MIEKKSSEGKSQNSAVQNLRINDEKKKNVQPLALVPTVSRLKKKLSGTLYIVFTT